MKILITGATKGIGLAEAELFNKPENQLFIVARHTESLGNTFKDAVLINADLTKPEDIEGAVKQVKDRTSILDILINNVGVMVMKKFEDMQDEDINLILDLNLRSHILITKSLLPLLSKSDNPRVIFMSSMAAKASIVGESVYSATKNGITAFANVLRNERPVGIKVSTVHAWGVNTWGAKDNTGLLQANDIAEAVYFIATRPKEVLVESIDLGNISQWRGGEAPWSPK